MKVVKPFLTQKHITYPVVVGKLAQQYKLTSMDLKLMIDRNGKIQALLNQCS